MPKPARVLFSNLNLIISMNRILLPWGIAVTVFGLNVAAVRGQSYEFAVVSNSVTAGINLNAVANNQNVFVCVGGQNSPVLSVNTNDFASFATNHFNGGYLLYSNAWTKSPKNYWFNCVAAQPNGFVASGTSNAVYLSSDGVTWTRAQNVLPAGDQAYASDGITYNPGSGTYAAALAVYEAYYAANPTIGWTQANLASESFAESFRAVTSFAGNSMALCGILGDIRISTNGGQYWNVSKQANLNYPSLLSVASDETNWTSQPNGTNLVCVGDNSFIEVSTNGGVNATWKIQTQFNIGVSGSPTNFNAVTYGSAANAFLAAGTVGANGLIVMAPELPNGGNWTWTRQTNLWNLQNGTFTTNANALSGRTINGASFANTNFFQGIAMLVGNNGTVVVGGLPPVAPVNPSNIDVTNILSSPPVNAALAPTIVGDANHPVSILTVDWYASSTGGKPVALNAFSYEPTNENCGTYTNWAEERDLRTGFVSTNRTAFVFTIIPGTPTDPVSVTNCDPIGQRFGMCFTFPMLVTVVTNGANPPGTIQVNWYDANSNLVAAGTSFDDNDLAEYTPAVSPGIYTFYAQATNPATGFVSPGLTPVTFQENALPQWANSPEFYTNTLTEPFQTNPVMTVPAIINLSEILSIEPGASILVDWYTNSDPTVSTFENGFPPIAYGGALTSGATWGLPGGVVSGKGTTSGFIPTNRLCGTYTYYARVRVVDPAYPGGCACQSTNLIPVTFVLLPPAPIDSVENLTNALTGAVQTNTAIWVDLLTNADNPSSSFVVNWYATPQGSNALVNLDNSSETNLNNRFFLTPTNATCGVFTNWAETMAINSGSGGSAVSTNRIPVVFAIIPATPTALTALDAFDQTNCIEVPNPTFTVAVTNGQTADWFTVPSSGTPVTNGLSLTPTNSSVGTWTFSAEAVDPVSGLASTGSVLATLNLYNCTNALAISLNPAAGTSTIQWPGNLTLLSATNLTPPVAWTSVSTGSMFLAPNTLTFTNTNPPTEFFRLTN